jgi:hypothetical protein
VWKPDAWPKTEAEFRVGCADGANFHDGAPRLVWLTYLSRRVLRHESIVARRASLRGERLRAREAGAMVWTIRPRFNRRPLRRQKGNETA